MIFCSWLMDPFCVEIWSVSWRETRPTSSCGSASLFSFCLLSISSLMVISHSCSYLMTTRIADLFTPRPSVAWSAALVSFLFYSRLFLPNLWWVCFAVVPPPRRPLFEVYAVLCHRLPHQNHCHHQDSGLFAIWSVHFSFLPWRCRLVLETGSIRPSSVWPSLLFWSSSTSLCISSNTPTIIIMYAFHIIMMN